MATQLKPERELSPKTSLNSMEEKTKKEELGEFPDEESKKIAEDIAAEEKAAKEKAEAEKKEDKKPEDNEDDAGKKSEDDKGKEDDEDDEGKEDEEDPPKRSPKLMPAWKHEAEKGQWGKEKTELTKEISDLKQKLEGKSEPVQDEAIKKFAEKHGWEEEAIKDLLSLLPKGPNLSEEVSKRLQSLEDKENQIRQERGFEKFFARDVVPLMEKDELTDEQKAKVKKKINTLAFTTKYVNNDLDEIYIIAKQKGELDNIILPKGKKSAENSRGGMSGAKGETLKELTEEEALELGDEEFKKWSEEQAKKAPDSKIWSVP